MDASLVVYTSIPLSYIPVAQNDNLNVILGHINTAINTSSSAPDYSGYNLYCVKEVDGTTHPTNTQNFAEGISKMLCDFKTAYTTFTGTTYVSDKGVFTTAITNLQSPAYTYVPFSITSADGINTVWSKTFTGLTSITNSIKPDSANWSTIGASNATSIVSAFNTIIAYEVTQDGLISGKQASLGTFNTTSIGGSTGTVPITTITELITAVAAVPAFTPGSITSTCVTAGGSLQAVVQNTINSVDTISAASVTTAGTGLLLSGSGCGGKTLAIDTSWSGLNKVKVSAGDSTGGYLFNKLTSTDASVTLTDTGSTLNMSVSNPSDGKVKINAFDESANYLQSKITFATSSDSGLGIIATTSIDNNTLSLTPTINYSSFWGVLADFISTDPDALSKLATLIQQVNNIPGLAVINLIVTLVSSQFVLNWSHQSGSSQTAKWRAKGNTTWQSIGFTPTNPLSGTAITSTGTGITIPVNVPAQFQVDTVYPTGTSSGNIYESIMYASTTLNSSVLSGVITVSQIPLPIDTVQYRLRNSVPAIIQNFSASGLNPGGEFGAVASGTYTVQWRFGTTLNGSTLYSDDASQIGSWFTSGSIVVP